MNSDRTERAWSDWRALDAVGQIARLTAWASGSNLTDAAEAAVICARALAEAPADPARRWWLHRVAAEAAYYEGRLTTVLEHVQAATALDQHAGDRLLLYVAGMVFARLGDAVSALEHGHQLRAIARTPREEALALMTLAGAHFARRNTARACQLIDAAAERAEAAGLAQIAALARVTEVGFLHIHGEVELALQRARALVVRSARLAPAFRARADAQLASLLAATGDFAASAHIADGLRAGTALTGQFRYTNDCTYSEALIGLGRYAEARVILEATVEAYAAEGELSYRWFMHEALADCCAKLGDFEAAWQQQRAARRWYAAKVEHQSNRRFEVLDSHFRLSYAEARATALREANDALRVAARTDPLTELPNRRVLYEVLRERCATGGAGVLVIDADHFKRVNDLFSHLVGDDVLCRLAQVLRASVGAQELVARFGGEEFVAVISAERLGHAIDVAERMRIAVETDPWGAIALGLSVTISVGVALVRQGESVNDVLERADLRLLTAKARGRNQVCFEGDARKRIDQNTPSS